MNGTTGTTKKAWRSSAFVRRLGAGSVLTVALITVGASPALAGTGHSAVVKHSATATRTKGTRIANPVAVKLGPAVTITRTHSIITVVH